MISLETVLEPCGSFVTRTIGAETIFLSAGGDEVHTLNETGTLVWRCIDGTRPLRAIARELCSAFEVAMEAAEADLLRFAAELAGRGLVREK